MPGRRYAPAATLPTRTLPTTQRKPAIPELPEVETIRRGLAPRVIGRRIAAVEVHHPRAVRRHVAGASDFAHRLAGCQIAGLGRRGKFLWFVLDSGDAAITHLGMSGQLLLTDATRADPVHLRVRLLFDDGDPQLRFVDQRTFGGMWLSPLAGPDGIPDGVTHIAPDPLDPRYDEPQGWAAFHAALRRRRSGVKRALLDQTLLSGVGNIYADEALWRARLHYARPTATMRRPESDRLLRAVRDVLVEAITQGGTSFDRLYVDADGASGYFARSLNAYGRAGQPCARCGTPIARESFMNRSSFRCPRCQPVPRPHV